MFCSPVEVTDFLEEYYTSVIRVEEEPEKETDKNQSQARPCCHFLVGLHLACSSTLKISGIIFSKITVFNTSQR
jgi:hypothetical protein